MTCGDAVQQERALVLAVGAIGVEHADPRRAEGAQRVVRGVLVARKVVAIRHKQQAGAVLEARGQRRLKPRSLVKRQRP
jgi:hypothetical protein